MSKVVSLLPPQSFFDDNFEVLASEEGVSCKSPFRTCLEVDQGDTVLCPQASFDGWLMSVYSAVRYEPVPWDAKRSARCVTQCCNSSRKEHSFENNVIIPQKLFQFCCSFHSSLFLLAWISLLVIRWWRSGKLKSTEKVTQTTDQSLILSGWCTVVVFQNFHIKRLPKFSEFSVIGVLASLILTRTPKVEFP